jgi:hypothetical protein
VSWNVWENQAAWFLDTGNVLRRGGQRSAQYGHDDHNDNASILYATDALIIDVTGLT